jgi:hypothetical protein
MIGSPLLDDDDELDELLEPPPLPPLPPLPAPPPVELVAILNSSRPPMI